MAADKEIMRQIETLRLDRPGRAVKAADMAGCDAEVIGPQLIEALRELAATFRDEAELWTKSGARGWKSSEADAYLVEQQLTIVAGQLDNASSAPAREPFVQTEAATTHERLDNLVSSAVAEGRGLLRDVAAGETVSSATDLQPLDMGEALGVTPDQYAEGRLAGFAAAIEPGATGDAIGAYLSGAVDTLPGLAEALVPGSIPRMAEADNPFASAADRVALDTDAVPPTWESETMTADGHTKPGVAATAPPLGQPGDMGAGYSHDYVPPGGRRVTFAELLTPVPVAALPPHVSNSQIDTVGDCGAKYRMQRIDQLPQIPQWANIGGTTFHAAVEAFERTITNLPHDKAQANGWKDYDCERTWRHHFEAQIAVVQATTTVPISSWRAARKGAEGRAWWEVNGPLMLRRYLDARPAEPSITIDSGGTPAIEWEVTADVPTNYGPVPFVAKIDRVTVSPLPNTVIIRDYKSSYEKPTDTTQLGDYAWSLIVSDANLHGATRILGTFFDARRGEWTEPVDLLAAHPFESFQYRVTAAHAQKRALTTGPTPARPSSYCGGCSVRYACPVMASKS